MNIKCKKVCIIFVICLLLFGCSNENEEWHTINLEGCGTMMIPKSFELKKEQDIYYIKNTDNNEIELLGYLYKNYETKDDIKFSILNYNIHLEKDDTTNYLFDCQSFSNSASFGEEPVIVNGEPTKQFFISTYGGDEMVDWITTPESSLDYDEIKKITESYVSE